MVDRWPPRWAVWGLAGVLIPSAVQGVSSSLSVGAAAAAAAATQPGQTFSL